ncbi:uncharacterized protein BJ212DRAFT_1295358 [Suillus subaureus]|uniref:Uncharacterized protein n=1 Tax=Suillus subaureus TaxID=48587 RepID=A0A9P7ENK3_9AGAM|nr:uncharacterized protein BJ212DRAFT_1295358 [Suillus subaureus]KAG1826095.1 hypothetical protein BJ212DRAFT_1295358 [Suillus subaureus]
MSVCCRTKVDGWQFWLHRTFHDELDDVSFEGRRCAKLFAVHSGLELLCCRSRLVRKPVLWDENCDVVIWSQFKTRAHNNLTFVALMNLVSSTCLRSAVMLRNGKRDVLPELNANWGMLVLITAGAGPSFTGLQLSGDGSEQSGSSCYYKDSRDRVDAAEPLVILIVSWPVGPPANGPQYTKIRVPGLPHVMRTPEIHMTIQPCQVKLCPAFDTDIPQLLMFRVMFMAVRRYRRAVHRGGVFRERFPRTYILQIGVAPQVQENCIIRFAAHCIPEYA